MKFRRKLLRLSLQVSWTSFLLELVIQTPLNEVEDQVLHIAAHSCKGQSIAVGSGHYAAIYFGLLNLHVFYDKPTKVCAELFWVSPPVTGLI